LCDKYRLANEVRRFQERKWCELSFELAFLERDLIMAKRIIDRSNKLHFKYFVKYYCMQNKLVYMLLIKAIAMRRRFSTYHESGDFKYP
jgi:hypothetical protein